MQTFNASKRIQKVALTGMLLLLGACSHDDLPETGTEQPEAPLSESGQKPIEFRSGFNETRSTAPLSVPTFMVYGLKSDDSQSQIVFDGVTVSQTNNGYQYNDHVRYWDYGMHRYQFFGYYYDNNEAEATTFERSNKLVPISAFFHGVTPTKFPFYTKIQEVAKDDFGKQVVMEFAPLMAQLRVGFYTEQTTAYITDLQFFEMDNDTPSNFPILNCEMLTKTNYKLNILTNEITVRSSHTTANQQAWTKWANDSWNTEENTLPTTSDTAWMTDYSNILPNPGNVAPLQVRMKYKVSGTEISTPLVATIPAPIGGWQTNKKYTYLFKLTHSSDPTLQYELFVNNFTLDDLSTFVGDLFKIENWTNHEITEDFDKIGEQ